MSGWNGSDRRETLPENWSELVSAVWKRDKGRCTWRLPSGARCPRRGRDVDHKWDREDHRLEALQLLCGDHHDRKTQAEARRAKQKRKASGRRPPEEHPGQVR